MSNFTTFFPSAGGGGGEGSGINSYAPFKVGTADNNPQGYIHSTGVYTNPIDSSVWLKTGNQVSDTTNAYPNAYAELDHRLTSGTDALSANLYTSIAYNGTDVYALNFVANSGPYFRVYPIDLATRTWGSLINKDSSLVSSSSGCFAIGYDSTAGGWLSSDASAGVSVINKWNAAFTSITSTFSIFSEVGAQKVEKIAFDVVNNQLFVSNNYADVYIYDLSNDSYTNTTFNTTSDSGVGTITGMSIHPTTGNVWVEKTDIVYELNPSTGVKTGNQFNLYPNTYITNGIVKGIAWKDADTLLAITGKTSSTYVLSDYDKDGIRVLGDTTARTDSSGSAQPLFIKLK